MAKANGIYERKGRHGDITYCIRYQFKTMDGEGNEITKDIKEKVGRKSRGFTRELARLALKAREGEIAQGRFNLEKAKKPHPIAELLQRYHKHAKSYKASYSRGRYALDGFAKYFESHYLSDIMTWGIERWKRDREKQVQRSTVNRELTDLKHMLKMGVKWGLIPVNPAAGVSPFPVQEGRIRYLSEDEIPALLEACEKQVTSPWLYPLVVLALNTAARQGELRYEDVDFERGLIYFGRTKNRKLKTIPMNKTVKEAVEWLLKHRYSEYLFSWPWVNRLAAQRSMTRLRRLAAKPRLTKCASMIFGTRQQAILLWEAWTYPRSKRYWTPRDRDDVEVFPPSPGAQSQGRGEVRRGFEQSSSEPREPHTAGARTPRFGSEPGTKQEHFSCTKWSRVVGV
jgi:integrase